MYLDSESLDEWRNLDTHAANRYRELASTFAPLVAAIDSYEQLACRLVLCLGHTAILDNQDDALLDIFAESFDALRGAKRKILEWAPGLDYSLLRRAYETTSLFAYLVAKPAEITGWQNGRQIGNKEIREFLAKNPPGEPLDELRRNYSELSEGTHANRGLIPIRHLGHGNEFTLGSIGRPRLTLAADHLFRLAGIWFWLMAVAGYRYIEMLGTLYPKYGEIYLRAATNIQEVTAAIESQWDKLVEFDETGDTA